MESHCPPRYRWSARVSAALLGVGALALAPAPADALPDTQWGPSVRVSLGVPVGAPDVVVAPRTGTGVVWTGAVAGAGSPDVRFRQQTPDGTWQPPVSLGQGGGAQIGADQSGNMVAAWFRQRPGMIPEIVAARRAVGHRWGAPVVISRTGENEEDGTAPRNLDLAVSSGGAAVAAWRWGSDEGGPLNRVQAAYLPAGGTWTGPVDLTTPTECDGRDNGVATAIGPGGRAVVVCLGSMGRLHVVRQQAGQWPDPVPISSGSNLRPDVAVGPEGETVVVWSHIVPPEEEGGESSDVIETTRLLGDWTPPEQLTPIGEDNDSPRVAVSSAGATTVVWVGSTGVIRSRWRTAGATPYGAVQTLASPGPLRAPLDLVANLDGDAVAAWAQAAPGGSEMASAVKPGAGAWGAAVVLSGSAVVPAEDPTGVAIGGCGRATVAWQGTYTRLRRTVDCL